MYHYKSYFEDLFNFNSTAKESHQTASLWVQDTPGQHDDGTNPALLKIFKSTKGSALFDVAGKLHCDLFNISKYLLNEVNMRFLFVRNKPEVYLMKSANVTSGGKFKVEDATLWIRKIKVSPSILLAHANSLSHHTAKYAYKRVEMQNHTLPQGSQKHTIENMYLGRIPTRIIVAFVTHAAFSGHYEKSPFNFQHFGLNYLSVFKNGEQVNCRPYTPSFGDKNPCYAIPYLQSFFNTGNLLQDDGYCVSMNDWQKGFAVYPFDLTPELSANENHWCLQEQGNIRLEVGFSEALKEPITAVVYAEFRDLMQVDKNRECILD